MLRWTNGKVTCLSSRYSAGSNPARSATLKRTVLGRWIRTQPKGSAAVSRATASDQERHGGVQRVGGVRAIHGGLAQG